MIKVFLQDRTELPLTVFRFNGGEMQVRLDRPNERKALDEVRIDARLFSSDDVMALLLTVDAWRRMVGPDSRIYLRCPYVPYARQDRVCARGEALSITVMANLLNSLDVTEIEIWDAHSDVTPALLQRCKHVGQSQLLWGALANHWDALSNSVLVAPDAGATKKIHEANKAYAHRPSVPHFPVLQAFKVRNPETGEITGTALQAPNAQYDGRPFLVVDDICDGGRTFIELAKVLRQQYPHSPLYLYVTHGIFSKGFDELQQHYRHIYCANPWPGIENSAICTITS